MINEGLNEASAAADDSISFMVVTKLGTELHVNNQQSLETSNVLHFYSDVNNRFTELVRDEEEITTMPLFASFKDLL